MVTTSMTESLDLFLGVYLLTGLSAESSHPANLFNRAINLGSATLPGNTSMRNEPLVGIRVDSWSPVADATLTTWAEVKRLPIRRLRARCCFAPEDEDLTTSGDSS
jgi:hypothetical protein